MIDSLDRSAISNLARKILAHLVQRQPQSVSHLAHEYQCSPRLILAAIEALQNTNCLLEHLPEGILLRQSHWTWWRSVLEDISSQRGSILGRHVLAYESTGSTNDVCRQAAVQGRPKHETLVVLADQQSAGRGRQGHRWEARCGQSLLLSVLLPADQNLHAQSVTLCAAIACARSIERFTHHPVHLKWPNDVMVAGRKIAGILVETIPAGPARRSGSRSCPAVIVGIGINVAQNVDDFPVELQTRAGSILMVCGQKVDRLVLAAELLGQIEHCCLPGLSPQQIAVEWKSRCHLVNRMVRLTHHGVELHGRVTDLDPSVGLVITDAHGRTHFADAGATSLVET